MTSDSNMMEAALLRTMTLLASLNVAAEISFGMRDRKAGRDPSAEEQKDIALPVLQDDLQILKALTFQLQSSLALSLDVMPDTHEQSAISVQCFIDLMRLQKSSRILQSIHQRLLSLYPAIDEYLAEEARQLKNACDHLKDADSANFVYLLNVFISNAQQFSVRVRALLK